MKIVCVAVCVLAPLVAGCESDAARAAKERQQSWEEPCHDFSVLLATTSGSPSSFECPNQRHRMRVQIATTQTNEEAAALVFCECESGDGGT